MVQLNDFAGDVNGASECFPRLSRIISALNTNYKGNINLRLTRGGGSGNNSPFYCKGSGDYSVNIDVNEATGSQTGQPIGSRCTIAAAIAHELGELNAICNGMGGDFPLVPGFNAHDVGVNIGMSLCKACCHCNECSGLYGRVNWGTGARIQ